MKSIFVALFLVSVGFAAPQINPYYRPGAPGAFVPIVSQYFDLNPDGSGYRFGYQSGDGSARDETGVLKYAGTPGEAMGVQGQYSYASPEGPVQVSYVADENGFQPSGPGVHPDIQKAVAEQVAEAQGKPVAPVYPGAPFRKY